MIEGDLDLAERASGEYVEVGLDLQVGNAEPIYVSFVVKVLNLAGEPSARWPWRRSGQTGST